MISISFFLLPFSIFVPFEEHIDGCHAAIGLFQGDIGIGEGRRP